MKVISIRELHQHTGRFVREAVRQPIFVTDRGRQVAVLTAPTPAQMTGKPFPRRPISSLPRIRIDSTVYISEERDSR